VTLTAYGPRCPAIRQSQLGQVTVAVKWKNPENMKRNIQFISSLVCLALSVASANAAPSYWDSNGSTAGAGTAPNGTWDADAFWSTSSGGTASTTTWTSGDTAVFSAGTDATDSYTNTIATEVTAGGIIFEDGNPTIAGGKIILNAADWPVIANTDATISASLQGGISGTFGFKKTGPGTLTLSGDNWNNGPLNGTNTIAEGVVIAAHAYVFGGDTTTPTIVSNGATLQVNITALSDNIMLHGNGVTNSGAFRDALTANGACPSQIILGSDAKIQHNSSGNFSFTGQYLDGTNNPNGFANLTIAGDGSGFHRFNIGGYPAIRLGQGVLIKEGLCQHNFEVPNDIGAVYFNQGHLNWRANGPNGAGTGVVYAAASAGQIRSTSENKTIGNAIVLAPGADQQIHVFPPNGPLTFSGVISGLGGLTTTSNGIVKFENANTYSGNTTIRYGTLALGPSGSISNSSVIDVQTPTASLDISNDFVLEATQTLKCSGTCNFSNSLTLLGNLVIGVDKSLSPANGVINVTGAITNAGVSTTLEVTRVGGPSLLMGDSFQIFNQAVANGQLLNVTGAGATWTNRLAQDGSIAVLVAPPPDVPATNLTIQATGPNSFNLGGQGPANSPYSVYASTNMTTPMSNWWKLGTTNSSGAGVIQYLDSQATNAQRFYRFGQP